MDNYQSTTQSQDDVQPSTSNGATNLRSTENPHLILIPLGSSTEQMQQHWEKDILQYVTKIRAPSYVITFLRFISSISDQVKTGPCVYSPDYRVMNLIRQHITNHPSNALA